MHELTLKKWTGHILSSEWQRAETACRRLQESREKFWSWLGSFNLAVTSTCRGRARDALTALDGAVRTYTEAPHLVALARISMSHLLIETGRWEAATETARQAMTVPQPSPLASEALFFFAQAKLRQGQPEEAEQIARQNSFRPPGGAEARRHQLQGEAALQGGDLDRGVRELERARAFGQERESSRPAAIRILPHVRFSLASAYLRTQRFADAARELECITADRSTLFYWAIPYIRSLFLLGVDHDRRGESSKARIRFERFLAYWQEGEMDRDRVEQAEKRLSPSD